MSSEDRRSICIGDRVAIGRGIKVFVVVAIMNEVVTIRPKGSAMPLLDAPMASLVPAP